MVKKNTYMVPPNKLFHRCEHCKRWMLRKCDCVKRKESNNKYNENKKKKVIRMKNKQQQPQLKQAIETQAYIYQTPGGRKIQVNLSPSFAKVCPNFNKNRYFKAIFIPITGAQIQKKITSKFIDYGLPIEIKKLNNIYLKSLNDVIWLKNENQILLNKLKKLESTFKETTNFILDYTNEFKELQNKNKSLTEELEQLKPKKVVIIKQDSRFKTVIETIKRVPFSSIELITEYTDFKKDYLQTALSLAITLDKIDSIIRVINGKPVRLYYNKSIKLEVD